MLQSHLQDQTMPILRLTSSIVGLIKEWIVEDLVMVLALLESTAGKQVNTYIPMTKYHNCV